MVSVARLMFYIIGRNYRCQIEKSSEILNIKDILHVGIKIRFTKCLRLNYVSGTKLEACLHTHTNTVGGHYIIGIQKYSTPIKIKFGSSST